LVPPVSGAAITRFGQVQFLDVRKEDAAGEQMVHGHFEEALDLVGMEVHGHDPVHAGGSEHIGHQLGADAHPWLVLAVLSGESEIGHHGHDALGTGALGGIHHQQQLEEVVAGREGALHDEHQFAAHGLLEAGLELPVAEAAHGHLAQALAAELAAIFSAKYRVAVPLKILALSCMGWVMGPSPGWRVQKGCKCSDPPLVINTCWWKVIGHGP
jgi:hypothetical protein